MDEYIIEEKVEYVNVVMFQPSEVFCLAGYMNDDMNKTCLLKIEDKKNDKIFYSLAMYSSFGWVEVSTRKFYRFDDHFILLGYYRIWKLTESGNITY